MAKLTHVSISIGLFRLRLRGCYEMAIVGLIHSFKDKGLMMSNGSLATTFGTHERTIERAIARLKKQSIIMALGTGRNDRCLVLTPDTMSVLDADMMSVQDPTLRGVTPDMTADHKLRSKEEVNSRFDQFWKAYPKKAKRPRALKAWQKINPDQGLIEQIMVSVEAHKESDQWTKEGGTYIPHPDTWLNDESWNDQLDPVDSPDTNTLGTRPATEEDLALLEAEGVL